MVAELAVPTGELATKELLVLLVLEWEGVGSEDGSKGEEVPSADRTYLESLRGYRPRRIAPLGEGKEPSARSCPCVFIGGDIHN